MGFDAVSASLGMWFGKEASGGALCPWKNLLAGGTSAKVAAENCPVSGVSARPRLGRD